MTIHLIEPTLDTGAILAQERAHPPVGSDPARMRVENVIVARRSLPEAVEALLQGTAEPVAQGGARTPVYRLRDLTLERRVELLRRLGHPL